MLVLLFAAQLSSTNCIPDYTGGMMCTTLSTPQMHVPDMSQEPARSSSGCGLCNLISILDGSAKKRHEKAVGKMLAKGDCEGAERYALQKGELDLAEQAKAYCAETAPASGGSKETDLEQFERTMMQKAGNEPAAAPKQN
jgi:hypothetical protein